MPQGANVVVQSQKIVVNPSTKSVAVINAGPQGPPGAAGPVGPPGPGVPDQYVKADGSVPMSGLLLGVGVWEAVQSRFGDGTSVQPVFVQGKAGSGYIAFFSNITDLATQGARTGYVGFVSNNLRIASELAGGLVQVTAEGVVGPSFSASALNMPATHSIAWGTSPVGLRLGLYGTAYGIGIQSSALYYRAGSNADHAWFTAGVHSDTNEDPGAGGKLAMVLRPDGLYLPDPTVANLVVGASSSAGARIRFNVPSTGNVVYMDFAGNGAAGTETLYLRAGTVSVFQLEDTVVRSLKPFYVSTVARFQHGSVLWGTGDLHCYMGFYKNATNVDTLGTRSAYLGFSSNDFYINNETGVNTRVLSGTGVLILGTGSTERTRVETSGQAWGRTIAAYATDAGFDIRSDGRFISTMDGTSAYNWMLNIGAADAAGGVFLTLRRSTTPAQIGSITQVATTGVAFNTTSHGPHKHVLYELDDDEALARVEKWRPVAYQWKFGENRTLDEDGTPGGEIEHGFIAQEMYEVNPNAVTPGYGTQAEQKEWLARDKEYNDVAREIEGLRNNHEEALLEADGKYEVEEPVFPELPEPVGPEPFQPWQGDWTKLVPDLSAAVQALIRQNRAMAARIDELERSSR